MKKLLLLLLIIGCSYGMDYSKIYLKNGVIILCDYVKEYASLKPNLPNGKKPSLLPIRFRKIAGYKCYNIKNSASLNSTGLKLINLKNNKLNYENKIDIKINLIKKIIFKDGSSISIEEINRGNKLWGFSLFILGSIYLASIL